MSHFYLYLKEPLVRVKPETRRRKTTVLAPTLVLATRLRARPARSTPPRPSRRCLAFATLKCYKFMQLERKYQIQKKNYNFSKKDNFTIFLSHKKVIKGFSVKLFIK